MHSRITATTTLLSLLGAAEILVVSRLAPQASWPALILAILTSLALLTRFRLTHSIANAGTAVIATAGLAQWVPFAAGIGRFLSLADFGRPPGTSSDLTAWASLAVPAIALLVLQTPWARATVRPGQAAKPLRSNRRIPCKISGTFTSRLGTDKCQVLDMSEGGLLLALPPHTPLTEGDSLDVEFPIGDLPLTAKALVVHLGRKGPNLCGVRFLGLQTV